MSGPFTLREATEADARAIFDTLTAAILGLTQGHYDDAQRQAWAPVPEEFGNWLHRLAGLQTLMAEKAGDDGREDADGDRRATKPTAFSGTSAQDSGDADGQSRSKSKSRTLGFISFTQAGHIDLLFTAPQAARRGVATALYAEAERRLASAGVTRLRTEASLVSHAFFARQGFVEGEMQEVERRGVRLRRFAMSKRLGPG